MESLQIVIQNKDDGRIWDITELCSKISIKSGFEEGQPSKCRMTLYNDRKSILKEGSIVSVKYNDKGIFFGYVFKRSITDESIYSCVCFDQMRYLKNKDVNVFISKTASDIFSELCDLMELNYDVKHASNYKCLDIVQDNKSYYEMIQYAIDETFVNTGKWYSIRDNFGTLEFFDLEKEKTNKHLHSKYNINSFSYDTSIDDDTFNQIKLIRENSETNKREVFIVKDSESISNFGTLQYFDVMNEGNTDEQIKNKAETLLKLKNKISKKFRLKCLGDFDIFAGAIVQVTLLNFEKEGLNENQDALVLSCEHNLENNYHSMDLELMLI